MRPGDASKAQQILRPGRSTQQTRSPGLSGKRKRAGIYRPLYAQIIAAHLLHDLFTPNHRAQADKHG